MVVAAASIVVGGQKAHPCWTIHLLAANAFPAFSLGRKVHTHTLGAVRHVCAVQYYSYSVQKLYCTVQYTNTSSKRVSRPHCLLHLEVDMPDPN